MESRVAAEKRFVAFAMVVASLGGMAWAAVPYQTYGPISGVPVDVLGDSALGIDGQRLVVHSLSTSAETVVFDDAGATVKEAFLTPYGAIFNAGYTPSTTPVTKLYEIHNGVLLNADPSVATGDTAHDLRASGNYVQWSTDRGTTPFNHTLSVRDLSTGVNTTIAPYAGNLYNDVNASGDVVFWGNGKSEYNIWRYGSGTTTLLTTSPLNPINLYPRIAGTAGVVFASKPALTQPTNPTVAVDFIDSSGAISRLAQWDGRDSLQPEFGYNANSDGWVVFQSPNVGGGYDLSTRSPSGVISLVTHLGVSADGLRVAPDGSIAFDTDTGLYLGSPTDSPILVSTAQNSLAVWNNGQWDIISGVVTPVPEPVGVGLVMSVAAMAVSRRPRLKRA